MYRGKISNSKIKNRGNLLVWGFVLAVMAAIAVGDAELVATAASANESFKSIDTDVTSGEAAVFIGENIQSIKFNKDEGIKGALRALGALYQKNIVPSAKVNGVLGFTTLRDVTFEEAMDAVLGGKFEYEQKGNLIEVFSTGDESRMKHAVFPLHYISAAEAKKLIAPVLSSKGIVGVTTPAETGVPIGESISAPTGGGDTMSLRDTIVVYDYAENIKRAKEVITAIDIRPKQILIEATILSATLTEGMQLGVDLNLLAGVSLTGTEAAAGVQSSVGSGGAASTYLTDPVAAQNTFQQIYSLKKGEPLQVTGFAAAGGSGLRFGVTAGNAVAIITALESVTDITILANPKILAVNKQLGQVYIGDKIGYNSQTTVSEGGTATTKVSFLDTGTKLSFRPYISTEGYIRMDIHAKSSAKIEEGIISEASTELVSNIMVKDGQTIVIGGLFRDDVRTIRSQVPLLGDIPLIGAAFRSTTDSNIRQEIIVLLTPHIITEPEQTEGAARADDVARKRYGARRALQWVGRARLAEDRYTEAVEDYIDGDNKAALFKVNWALELRPTYLEAMRLKERIIGETAPDDVTMIERIMLDVIEREEANKWLRR